VVNTDSCLDVIPWHLILTIFLPLSTSTTLAAVLTRPLSLRRRRPHPGPTEFPAPPTPHRRCRPLHLGRNSIRTGPPSPADREEEGVVVHLEGRATNHEEERAAGHEEGVIGCSSQQTTARICSASLRTGRRLRLPLRPAMHELPSPAE
jgi:hypothetical protein